MPKFVLILLKYTDTIRLSVPSQACSQPVCNHHKERHSHLGSTPGRIFLTLETWMLRTQISTDTTVIIALILFLVIVGLCSGLMVLLFKVRESRRRRNGRWQINYSNNQAIEEQTVGFLTLNENDTHTPVHSLVAKNDVAFVNASKKKDTKGWRTYFSRSEEPESLELSELPSNCTKSNKILLALGKRLFKKKDVDFSKPEITEISSIITPGSCAKQSVVSLNSLTHSNYLKSLPSTNSQKHHSKLPYFEEETHYMPGLIVPLLKNLPKKKIKYSIRDLLDIQPNFLPSVPHGKLRTSELFSKRNTYEPAPSHQNMSNFYSVDLLLDSDSVEVRCLGYMALVGSGAFESLFENSLHFKKTFCDFMVRTINTLAIFRDTFQYPVLQLMLFDLAVCFVWEQWNAAIVGQERTSKILQANDKLFKPKYKLQDDENHKQSSMLASKHPIHMRQGRNAMDRTLIKEEDYEDIDLNYGGNSGAKAQMGSAQDSNSVMKSFRNHELHALTMLPTNEVFLLLCNLYLGSPDIRDSARSYFLSKLNGVFKACARRSPCHQHRTILPLVVHSIHATKRKHIVSFFYEIFLEILQTHISCCFVPADLFAANSPVQALVQVGLLPHQPTSVTEKANLAKNIVAKSLKNSHSPDAFWHVTEDYLEVRAPGAWNWSA